MSKLILRRKRRPLKKRRILRCKKCRSIYIATKDTVRLSETILGNSAYYSDCPACYYSNYYQDVL